MMKILRRYYRNVLSRVFPPRTDGRNDLQVLPRRDGRTSKDRTRDHKGLMLLILLTAYACISSAFAQEIAGQGWSASESRPRSSNAIPLAVTGDVRNVASPSSKIFIPVTLQKADGKNPMPPFPVLMPRTIVYPRKAIRRGWEGQAVVAVEVLRDGSVGKTALARSSGHEILDHAAENAIKTWKFEMESGKEDAVPQYVDIPVTFRLEGEPT